MDNFDKLENSKWGMIVGQLVPESLKKLDEVQAATASRGFFTPPGEAQGGAVTIYNELKTKLTEANGKLYNETLKDIFKLDELEQKINLGLNKLDLETYKAELDNAHNLKEAIDRYNLAAYRASIERLKSDVDLRQAAIIEESAKIKEEMIYWKRLQINAERISLGAEINLINEKVKTAEMKMEIIPYLYEVIAAEQLVMQAEQTRVEALKIVLYWEKLVAEAKRGMIHLYKEKALARLELAEATRIEAIDKKAYEMLGFDKLALKSIEEKNKHAIRLAESNLEDFRYNFEKAQSANELARAKSKLTLLKYQNTIEESVEAQENLLKDDEKETRINMHYIALLRELRDQINLLGVIIGVTDIVQNQELEKVVTIAHETCETTRASAHTKHKSDDGTTTFQYISGG
jgi:hypothetical protein